MNKIVINKISDFKPMNNNLLIQNISDSIEDSERNEKLNTKILIVRNEANQKRERSLAKVVTTASELYLKDYNSSKKIIPVDQVLGQNVIYDTMSRLAEIEIKEFPNEKFYLIRFPDVIAVVE